MAELTPSPRIRDPSWEPILQVVASRKLPETLKSWFKEVYLFKGPGGCFLKWWVSQTNPWVNSETKNHHDLGCEFWGKTHHLRKHPGSTFPVKTHHTWAPPTFTNSSGARHELLAPIGCSGSNNGDGWNLGESWYRLSKKTKDHLLKDASKSLRNPRIQTNPFINEKDSAKKSACVSFMRVVCVTWPFGQIFVEQHKIMATSSPMEVHKLYGYIAYVSENLAPKGRRKSQDSSNSIGEPFGDSMSEFPTNLNSPDIRMACGLADEVEKNFDSSSRSHRIHGHGIYDLIYTYIWIGWFLWLNHVAKYTYVLVPWISCGDST